MDLTISVLTGIGGAFIVLWALLWTYMKWQRVIKNAEADRMIKNIWWSLLAMGFIFLIAGLLAFQIG